MGEIVNLRAARKAKARADKERLAEQNRRKFGRTRAEREHDEKTAVLATRKLDSHRLNKDDDRDAET